MSDDDLEQRISSLEEEVSRLRAELAQTTADSSAARVLAAGADRDVSEVRVQLRRQLTLLNALKEESAGHSRRLTAIEGRLGGIDGRLDGIDGRLDRLESQVNAQFAQVDRSFERVEEQFRTVHGGLAHIVELLEAS